MKIIEYVLFGFFGCVLLLAIYNVLASEFGWPMFPPHIAGLY